MCGIVGYVGARPALGIVLDGLRRLEYRGYDSAGVAIIDDDALLTEKRAGKLANLEKALGRATAPPDGIAQRHHRHRAHPVGHARRADRPQRPPAPVRATAGSR